VGQFDLSPSLSSSVASLELWMVSHMMVLHGGGGLSVN